MLIIGEHFRGRQLAGLATICRSLQPIFESILYSDVVLLTSKHAYTFFETILVHRHSSNELPTFVRRFVIHVRPFSVVNPLIEKLGASLLLMKNLRVLSLGFFGPRSWILRDYCTHLQLVWFSSKVDADQTLLDWISTQRQLRILRLGLRAPQADLVYSSSGADLNLEELRAPLQVATVLAPKMAVASLYVTAAHARSAPDSAMQLLSNRPKNTLVTLDIMSGPRIPVTRLAEFLSLCGETQSATLQKILLIVYDSVSLSTLYHY